MTELRDGITSLHGIHENQSDSNQSRKLNSNQSRKLILLPVEKTCWSNCPDRSIELSTFRNFYFKTTIFRPSIIFTSFHLVIHLPLLFPFSFLIFSFFFLAWLSFLFIFHLCWRIGFLWMCSENGSDDRRMTKKKPVSFDGALSCMKHI